MRRKKGRGKVARMINGFDSSKMLILAILEKSDGEMSAKEIVARSDGVLSSRTVYVYLARLIQDGLVERRKEIVRSGSVGRPQAYVYKILEAVSEWIEENSGKMGFFGMWNEFRVVFLVPT